MFCVCVCVCVCVGGGVQICEGGSKSASGYGPGGGPNPRGVQICGGSKSAVTPGPISRNLHQQCIVTTISDIKKMKAFET